MTSEAAKLILGVHMQSKGIGARSSLSSGEPKMQINEIGILDVAKPLLKGIQVRKRSWFR